MRCVLSGRSRKSVGKLTNENETEIDLRWFDGARTIGVSAGASAPEFLVTGVVDALARLGPVEVSEHSVVVENVRFNLPAEVR